MDHTTCVVITVGRRDLEAQSVGKKSLEEQGTIKFPRGAALSFYGSKGERDGSKVTPSIQVKLSESSQQLRLVCRTIYADTLSWRLSSDQILQLTVKPPALDDAKLDEGFVSFVEDDFSLPLSRTMPLPSSVVGPSSGTATAIDAYTAVIVLDKK